LQQGDEGSFANKMQLTPPFQQLDHKLLHSALPYISSSESACTQKRSFATTVCTKIAAVRYCRTSKVYSLPQKKADSLHHVTIVTVRSFAKPSRQGKEFAHVMLHKPQHV